MRKLFLGVFVIVTILVVIYLSFLRTQPEQIDYSIRIGAPSLGESGDTAGGFSYLKLPLVGPYPATDYGDPPPEWQPLDFDLGISINANSRMLVSGSVEVVGGLSAPTSFWVTVSEKSESRNLLREQLCGDFVHVKFSKPNALESKGTFTAKLIAPDRPGVYWIHLSKIINDGKGTFVYARACFKVNE